MRAEGSVPVGNGDPVMGTRPPLEELMENADTVPPLFAAYTNVPEGSTATESGFHPVTNGEPAISVRVPRAGSML